MDSTDSDVRWQRVLLLVGAAALVAMVVYVGIAQHIEVFTRILEPKENAGMSKFFDAVEQLKGPANAVMAGVVPLGMAAGGAMMAAGQQKGMGIMGASAGSGVFVLLGNGVAA